MPSNLQLKQDIRDMITALDKETDAFVARVQEKDLMKKDILDKIYEKRKDRATNLAEEIELKYDK